MAYVVGSLTVDTTGFNGTLPAPTITGTGNPGRARLHSLWLHSVAGDDAQPTTPLQSRCDSACWNRPANVGVGTQTVIPNSARWTIGAADQHHQHSQRDGG